MYVHTTTFTRDQMRSHKFRLSLLRYDVSRLEICMIRNLSAFFFYLGSSEALNNKHLEDSGCVVLVLI